MTTRHYRTTVHMLAVIPVASLGLFGCASDDDDPMQVHIDSSQESEPLVLEATVGTTLSISDPQVGTFEVAIEAVKDDSVEFSTSELMSPEGDEGGINLNDPRYDFTVAIDEDVKFFAPVTGEGTAYTASLQDAQSESD